MKLLILLFAFAAVLSIPVEKSNKRSRESSPSDDPSDDHVQFFTSTEGYGDSTEPTTNPCIVVDPLFAHDVASNKRRARLAPYSNSWESTLHYYQLDTMDQLHSFSVLENWIAKQQDISGYEKFLANEALNKITHFCSEHMKWLHRVSSLGLPLESLPFQGIIQTYQVRTKHNFLLFKTSELLMSLVYTIRDLASKKTSPKEYIEILVDMEKSTIEVEDYYSKIQVAH